MHGCIMVRARPRAATAPTIHRAGAWHARLAHDMTHDSREKTEKSLEIDRSPAQHERHSVQQLEQHQVVFLQMVHQVADDRAVRRPAVGLGDGVDEVPILRCVVEVCRRLEQCLRAVLVIDVVEVIELPVTGGGL